MVDTVQRNRNYVGRFVDVHDPVLVFYVELSVLLLLLEIRSSIVGFVGSETGGGGRRDMTAAVAILRSWVLTVMIMVVVMVIIALLFGWPSFADGFLTWSVGVLVRKATIDSG